MTIFNTCKVSDIGEAASRAAFAAVTYILLLLFSSQVSFVSHSFGISPKVGLSFHGAFGVMAAAQGALHGTLKLLETKVWTWQTRLGLLSLCGLMALSLLAFARSRAYETFLVAHRVLAIVMALALWLHLNPQQNVARQLCFIIMSIPTLRATQHSEPPKHSFAKDLRHTSAQRKRYSALIFGGLVTSGPYHG